MSDEPAHGSALEAGIAAATAQNGTYKVLDIDPSSKSCFLTLASHIESLYSANTLRGIVMI